MVHCNNGSKGVKAKSNKPKGKGKGKKLIMGRRALKLIIINLLASKEVESLRRIYLEIDFLLLNHLSRRKS